MTSNKLVFTFVGSYVRANFGENPSRNATVRVPTDGHTDRLTDANGFYNLSHAICYSYGTDNKCTAKYIINAEIVRLLVFMEMRTSFSSQQLAYGSNKQTDTLMYTSKHKIIYIIYSNLHQHNNIIIIIIIIKAICNAQDPLKKAANALSSS